MTRAFYKNAVGAVVVCDVTRQSTLEAVAQVCVGRTLPLLLLPPPPPPPLLLPPLPLLPPLLLLLWEVAPSSPSCSPFLVLCRCITVSLCFRFALSPRLSLFACFCVSDPAAVAVRRHPFRSLARSQWKAEIDSKVVFKGGAPVPAVLLVNKVDLLTDAEESFTIGAQFEKIATCVATLPLPPSHLSTSTPLACALASPAGVQRAAVIHRVA